MCSAIMDPHVIGKPERRNRKPPSADARPRGQSPVPSESRYAGRTALCPAMSFSTGSGPNPSPSVLMNFGGWNHYSLYIHMSNFSWPSDIAFYGRCGQLQMAHNQTGI
jgi:hypothetical protein